MWNYYNRDGTHPEAQFLRYLFVFMLFIVYDGSLFGLNSDEINVERTFSDYLLFAFVLILFIYIFKDEIIKKIGKRN